MKKLPFFLILFFLFSLVINVKFATAAEFSQAYIRLDRTTPNTSLSGTVCAGPSSSGAGTEDRITVTFPTDFSISSSTSNWTTSTTDLPNGATAWPGISANASVVSGKSVTFDSNDLNNSSSLYCFNFSSSASSTGSTGNKDGNISTKNSSNVTIDSSDYGLTILTNDQISVSASAPIKASDYDVEINQIHPTDGNSNFSQDSHIDYEITYSSSLPFASPITLEAQWSQGTLEGHSSGSVEVLEYVVGSATDAYNSTPPVIDSVNKKITWTITSFPANTQNETVRFKLKTIGAYTGPKNVGFSTSGRLLFDGGATAYLYVNGNYNYFATQGPTPTPTPIKVPNPPTITSIGVSEISQDTATVYITTDTFTSKEVRYGTSFSNMNQRAASGKSIRSLFKLTGLKPETRYYFKAYVTDDNGKQTVSDIYSVQTARISTPLLANPLTLVVTSGNTILTSLGDQNKDFLVIPVGSPFQFKFAMLNKNSANSVRADLKDKNILGLLSFLSEENKNSDSTNLIEIEKGVYSGTLNTSQKPGNYILSVLVSDKNGNLKEQRLAEIKTINKFKVLSSANNVPVEGARVFLYIFNPTSKTYQVIPSNLISGGNPQLTDADGQLNLVLPIGIYRAEVSDLRHKSKTVEFEIGNGSSKGFPEVTLERVGYSFLNIFNYYKNVINDVFVYNTQLYSETLTGSPRFFDLVSMASLFGVVILTLFAFSKRHRIPVSYIPSYFYYLVDRNDRNDKYIHGVVYDEDDNPIPLANVYLTDKEQEKIISHTKTNKSGEFYFRRGKSKYLLMAMARNYMNSPVFQYHARKHLKFKINLKKEEEGLNLFHKVSHFATHFMGLSFEVLLVVSFIFEILFLNSFGIAKTLPFLLISIFNLTLWILHLHNKSHSKVVF